MTSDCAIPNCTQVGKHRLGVRCRVMEEPSPIAGKGKTDALWSVESDAFLCDGHAVSGLDVTLMFEANRSGAASVRVVGRTSAARKVTIKRATAS